MFFYTLALMRITNLTLDAAAQEELGSRLAQIRLNQNLSQASLAEEAGVTRITVHKIESGGNANLKSLLRVMRALGILGNLEAAIPELAPSPLLQAEAIKNQRRRASRKRSPDTSTDR